jgi:small subunit ribosomal protein S20
MPGATTAKKPVIRKSEKQARQALVRQARNQVFRSEMKSMIKLFLGYVQKGDAEKASKIFPRVVSAIDKGLKKNLIHKNNAANKKSGLQKALSKLQKEGKPVPQAKPAKAPKAEKAPKAPKAEKPVKKAAKK